MNNSVNPPDRVTLNRAVPVTGEYDVIVCGGGSAGWVAATAAARRGCRTALIERLGFLGGTATAGYVLPVSGFYCGGRRVVDGIAWEFIRRLERLGAAQIELPRGHISVAPEYFKLVAQQMTEEAGVELYTNTCLCECLTGAGNTVTHVIVSGKSGLAALRGEYFIDATGDGDLCALAGAPMLPQKSAEELQPLSLCFVLEGVDTSTELLRDCIRHNGAGGKGSLNAEIHEYLASCVEISDFCGPWFNVMQRGGCIAVNVTRTAADATDSRALTRAEWRLRQDMFRVVDLLRRHYPEFRNCEIVASGINAGVRESRHIRGRAMLTGDDMRSCRPAEHTAAYCAHPIDIHMPHGGGQELIRIDTPVPVPLECMLPEGFPNLAAAGRCLCADREGFASVRVQGTVMRLGESAGLAAADYIDAHRG